MRYARKGEKRRDRSLRERGRKRESRMENNRTIFYRREIVSAAFQFKHLIIESPRATRSSRWRGEGGRGGGKNLGNVPANEGRTENETRPSFPALNMYACTIVFSSAHRDFHDDRLRILSSPFLRVLIEERIIGSSLLDRSYFHGYLPVWISLNAMLREHVSDRSIGKRDDSMTISALLFSRPFRSFCCVIYVDRSLSNFLFLLLFLLNCWKV